MMRKLVFFLALFLPLQFAWAGAASYCQHETTPAQERHFGHHEHVHHGAVEKSAEKELAGDNDCGTCHAAGSALLPDVPSLSFAPFSPSFAADVRRPVPSALARAPDRPQWLRLASPARRITTM